MDLWNVAKVLWRRWLLFMGALSIAALVVAGMAVKVPVTYLSKSTILLLPPIQGGIYQPPAPATTPAKGQPTPTPQALPKIVNPYLAFDSTLFVVARIVSQDLVTDETKAELRVQGATAKYEVIPENDFPALTILVTDSDTQRISETISVVSAATVADLADRQKATGVPKGTWATAVLSTTPLSATRTNDRAKTLLIVAALGLVAAISMVFVVEGIASRRPPIESRPNVPRLLAEP
jgi:hypothetical protein